MTPLAAVPRALNEPGSERVVEDYAVGGAMAVLFYAEPARTYDLDVFVTLHGSAESLLDLSALYGCLKGRGFTPDAGHVLIHGVPVEFLPVYNRLVAVAVAEARGPGHDA